MEKYTVTKHFRCTREESEQINLRAEKERKPVSAFLRDAALSRNGPKMDETSVSLLEELKEKELEIGSGINAAARACSGKKEVSQKDYEFLTSQLLRIVLLRQKILEAVEKAEKGE